MCLCRTNGIYVDMALAVALGLPPPVFSDKKLCIVGTFRNDWLAAVACRPYTLPTIQKGKAKRDQAALESAATDRWVYFFNNIQNKFRSSDKDTTHKQHATVRSFAKIRKPGHFGWKWILLIYFSNASRSNYCLSDLIII